jgi:hypothetical protein
MCLDPDLERPLERPAGYRPVEVFGVEEARCGPVFVPVLRYLSVDFPARTGYSVQAVQRPLRAAQIGNRLFVITRARLPL